MYLTKRDFMKGCALLFAGKLLSASGVEAKVKGYSLVTHGYFKKGSESYGEILRLAEQVMAGNNKLGNSYERMFKSDSIIKGSDISHYSIDDIDVLVEDGGGDGQFNKGDRMSFHHQVEGSELYGGLFPSFVHTDNGIQVELPQKVLDHFEQLNQSMGEKVPQASYGGEIYPKQVPLKHEEFDRGGADKLIEQFKDAYLVKMLQTYQTFWRSLQPVK